MNVTFDLILKFAFDKDFPKEEKEIADTIRNTEMYMDLVRELQMMQEELGSPEEVIEFLELEKQKAKRSFDTLFIDDSSDF